jgi:hypothetical protein
MSLWGVPSLSRSGSGRRGYGEGHLEDHRERRDEAMKLATTTMVTVDGVMQGLGAPDEDRRGCSRKRPRRF